MDFFTQLVLAMMLVLLAGAQGAEAKMGAGDVIALILGLVLGILGICACIGKYARSRG